MTSAHPRHTLGSYKSSRTGGMLFTIDRRAVVRALSGSSPQQGTISAGEGALNTLAARANFQGVPITDDFALEALRDLHARTNRAHAAA